MGLKGWWNALRWNFLLLGSRVQFLRIRGVVLQQWQWNSHTSYRDMGGMSPPREAGGTRVYCNQQSIRQEHEMTPELGHERQRSFCLVRGNPYTGAVRRLSGSPTAPGLPRSAETHCLERTHADTDWQSCWVQCSSHPRSGARPVNKGVSRRFQSPAITFPRLLSLPRYGPKQQGAEEVIPPVPCPNAHPLNL